MAEKLSLYVPNCLKMAYSKLQALVHLIQIYINSKPLLLCITGAFISILNIHSYSYFSYTLHINSVDLMFQITFKDSLDTQNLSKTQMMSCRSIDLLCFVTRKISSKREAPFALFNIIGDGKTGAWYLHFTVSKSQICIDKSCFIHYLFWLHIK